MTTSKLISGMLILACLSHSAYAVIGIDLSQSFNNYGCIRDQGFEFVIARGYMSYGAVDYVGLSNVRNAKAAGLIADAYFFPCKG